jgi:pilus assembly protein CpaB
MIHGGYAPIQGEDERPAPGGQARRDLFTAPEVSSPARMNRRALIIALIVSLLGAALLAIYIRRFEEEASGGEPIKLLVAVKPIEAGTQITEDMLANRAVPRAYLEDRAVLDAERAKVIGLRVGHTVQAQQTLMWTDLAIAMEKGRSLSSLIQPGLRAVTVRTKGGEDKSFALIRPGDRIDVIATMPQGQTGDARSSVVLLQNVLVLAVGGDTGAEVIDKPTAQQQADMVLSLSLNVPEAQLLALATEKGILTVALRNPDDVRVTEGMNDINSSALSDSKVRGQVQSIRRAGPVKIETSGAQQ